MKYFLTVLLFCAACHQKDVTPAEVTPHVTIEYKIDTSRLTPDTTLFMGSDTGYSLSVKLIMDTVYTYIPSHPKRYFSFTWFWSDNFKTERGWSTAWGQAMTREKDICDSVAKWNKIDTTHGHHIIIESIYEFKNKEDYENFIK
jgi:hypothetical protein